MRRVGIDGYIENNGANFSYAAIRNRKLKEIQELVKAGHKIKFYKNNWIEINGISFNGWNEFLLTQAGVKYDK